MNAVLVVGPSSSDKCSSSVVRELQEVLRLHECLHAMPPCDCLRTVDFHETARISLRRVRLSDTRICLPKEGIRSVEWKGVLVVSGDLADMPDLTDMQHFGFRYTRWTSHLRLILLATCCSGTHRDAESRRTNTVFVGPGISLSALERGFVFFGWHDFWPCAAKAKAGT